MSLVKNHNRIWQLVLAHDVVEETHQLARQLHRPVEARATAHTDMTP